MDTVIRRRMTKDLCFMEVFRDDELMRKPLVILFHGHLSHKERVLTQAYYLAQNELFVLVPDAYMHGERNPYKKETDIFEVISKTSCEADALIDLYKNDERLDAWRFGIAGISMGGFVVYNYITKKQRRPKVAAAIISTPDYVSVMKTRTAAEYYQNRGIIPDSAEMDEMIEKVKRYQPLALYEAMKDIPLLMINGDKDEITSIEGSKKLYSLLEPLYSDKRALKLSIYKGVDHNLTYDMDIETADWIAHYLYDRDKRYV
jgi:dienelactone hydrolase